MIIYKITNLINDKIYIGQDIRNNPNYFGSGKLIKKAVKKYGKENFRKDIIEYCTSIENMNEREVYWIDCFNSTDRKNIGYNILEGGNKPPVHFGKRPEWFCKKISESKKGRPNGLLGKPGQRTGQKQSKEEIEKRRIKNTGKKRTEEFRKLMSDKHKGKKQSDEARLKMSIAKQNMSEETKKKIGLASIGRKISEETRKRLIDSQIKRRQREKDVLNV